MNNDDVMTMEELAKFLRISRGRLYRLVNNGGIPARKIGKQWRFSRLMIQWWLSGNNTPLQDVLSDAVLQKALLALVSMMQPSTIEKLSAQQTPTDAPAPATRAGKCVGITRDGLLCKRSPMPGSDYCHFHS